MFSLFRRPKSVDPVAVEQTARLYAAHAKRGVRKALENPNLSEYERRMLRKQLAKFNRF